MGGVWNNNRPVCTKAWETVMGIVRLNAASSAVMTKKTQDDWCATQPNRPKNECWNFGAWIQASDDEDCNGQWEDWDEYCYGCYNDACEAVDKEIATVGEDFWQ